MKYEVSTTGDIAQALGAYSGYRIRLVARRGGVTSGFALEVYFRGSESLPEIAVPVPEAGFASAAQAFDAGYAHAVAWIDRSDGSSGEAVG